MLEGFHTIVKEIRLALRSLLRRRDFTLLALSTIALGVGASTAIFSVVNGVLLQPLPYHEPERLITVVSNWSGLEQGLGSLSYPDLVDLESETPSIESLVGVNTSSMTLTGIGEPLVMSVTRLTKGLMDTFKIAPVLGRDVRSDEFGPEGPGSRGHLP